MSRINQILESKSILESLKLAGFKADEKSNRLKMQNNLNVSISEFLISIGFQSKDVIQNNRVWTEWAKEGIIFKINHRSLTETNAEYATVDFEENI